MSEGHGVMVHCETSEGKLLSIATELLTWGRKLADDLGEELWAVLTGHGLGNAAKEAVSFGADRVHVADHPLLEDYQTDPYLMVMAKIVGDVNPRILLMGQTAIGRDLGPALAFRLRTGLSMDCIDLAIDPDSKVLLRTRPVFGGNVHATFICKTLPQMATVRPKAISPRNPDAPRHGEIIPALIDIGPSAIRVKLLKKVKEQAQGLKLEDAEIVVCGGRGIGGPEGFKELENLARILRGAVGATRPPCDSGWISPSSQIGLTGKIISPQIYIGIAVSGTSQHLTGCRGAKSIIAINKDPEANIFKIARFGVVGDWKKVLPGFISALSAKSGQKGNHIHKDAGEKHDNPFGQGGKER